MSIGLKLKRYSNTFQDDSYNDLDVDWQPSNTDTSKWRPDLSQIRAQLGAAMSNPKKMLYDFPDGKDTGQVIQTVLRSPGLDITEVDSMEQRITQTIERKNKEDLSAAAKAKNRKEFLDAIKGVDENSDPGSSPSSQ